MLGSMCSLNLLLLLLPLLLNSALAAPCPASTPLLQYDWRDNDRVLPKMQWPFRTDSPLTQRLIDKGLYLGRQSSLYARVFSKLSACSKDAVSMMVLGGSFTRGNGCGAGADRCAWHYRFADWLRRSYPNASVNHINRAAFNDHSTKSFTIDTFAASKFSEIRTTTLRVHGTGIFLLHFKHVPLGDDERKARGDDKVKIVGLRSC
jgi:hypothetical protein